MMTISANRDSRDKIATIISGAASSSNANHNVDVGMYQWVALAITWAGNDAIDATATLQGSLDGTNFEEISGSAYTLAAAAGTHIWSVETRALSFLRVVYAKGANTVGTYTIKSKSEVLP